MKETKDLTVNPADKLTIKLSGAAVLAALSVIFQALPPIFLTPWFMRIDLVAVPWVICWVLFGYRAALISMIVSVPIVGALGPFAGGFVGAVMKSLASVWMFTIPAVFTYKSNVNRLLKNKKILLAATVAAIVIRDAATAIVNLYFAIPVFFGMTPNQVIDFFTNPRFQSFLGKQLGLIGFTAYFAEVFFWNTVQGVIDIYLGLTLAVMVKKRLKT